MANPKQKKTTGTDKKNNSPNHKKKKSRSKRITLSYRCIGALCNQALNTIIETQEEGRRRLASMRLLATILRAENRYDTVYEVLTRDKDYSDINNPVNNFQVLKRGRPTKEEQEFLKTKVRSQLLDAMENRGISPKRWCNAYGLSLDKLQNPDTHQDAMGLYVVDLLMEDFPEAFELIADDYKMRGVNPSRIYYKKYSRKLKKFIHIYSSETLNSKGVNFKEGQSLRFFNWAVSREVIEKRLKILLKEGVQAALEWTPKKTDAEQLAEGANNTPPKSVPDKPKTEVQVDYNEIDRLRKAAAEFDKAFSWVDFSDPECGKERRKYFDKFQDANKQLEAL